MRLKVGMEAINAPGARRRSIEPVHPICTPRLPSSHTCALGFFRARAAYDLDASVRSWFGVEACAAKRKWPGSRH
jgi:hypothetical protein